jgi:hypothetical protein
MKDHDKTGSRTVQDDKITGTFAQQGGSNMVVGHTSTFTLKLSNGSGETIQNIFLPLAALKIMQGSVDRTSCFTVTFPTDPMSWGANAVPNGGQSSAVTFWVTPNQSFMPYIGNGAVHFAVGVTSLTYDVIGDHGGGAFQSANFTVNQS